MFTARSYLCTLTLAGLLAGSATAQVRFDVVPNPYLGPGLTVSVGNGGYCRQPVMNGGYTVYPGRPGGGYVPNRPVVVVPVTNGYYNQGYYPGGGYYPNAGYYPAGNCNSGGYYVNNGYPVDNGYYNQGYRNPGYRQGYYNNGRRCR